MTQPLHGLVDMTNAEYHAAPGISSTQLKTIGTSPLAYWDAHVNPDREPRDEKHCFAVGDGTHKMVLEPGIFEHTYAVGFDKSAHPTALDTVADLKKALAEHGLMTSGAKPELAERLVNEADYPPEKIMLMLERQHKQTMEGRIPIQAKDFKDMTKMLDAIWRDDNAAGLLEGAQTEQSFFWTDPAGILRKCRTDVITQDWNYIIDLKTAEDISEDGFGWTISNLGYHVSAAWYLDVLYGLYGAQAPQGYAFIAVQKKRPYDVAVYYLTDRQIHLGRLIYRKYLATLQACMETGYWPGVTRGEIREAKIPEREMRRIEYLEAEVLV
jgi:PDDEXK-like domain of unknown function (DUF3799)